MQSLTNDYIATVPNHAKWAFTTRRVNRSDVAGVGEMTHNFRAGELVLCEITKIAQHKKIQLSNQRYSVSYEGDLVVLCLGDRYAPDQFMGKAEWQGEHLDLLAGGGIAGTVEKAHAKMSAPTQLRPVGLLLDRTGSNINIDRYALESRLIPNDVTVLGVFGASMNAGKTTAAVSLAHGLKRAGLNVAGVKATGTGAFGDFNAFEDASVPVTDFTDAGFSSTYRVPLEDIENGFETLVGQAAEEGANVVVVEIADGVFQRETKAILKDSRIIDRMDGVLFAAPDALGAVGGIDVLDAHGLQPFAISGMVSCSALGTQETEDTTGVPVVTRDELCSPETVQELTKRVIANRGNIVAQGGLNRSEHAA